MMLNVANICVLCTGAVGWVVCVSVSYAAVVILLFFLPQLRINLKAEAHACLAFYSYYMVINMLIASGASLIIRYSEWYGIAFTS